MCKGVILKKLQKINYFNGFPLKKLTAICSSIHPFFFFSKDRLEYTRSRSAFFRSKLSKDAPPIGK